MHLFLKLLLPAALGCAPMVHAWTLNDVSILLPLPKASEQDFLLGPDAKGARGSLLSKEVFENLPNLVAGFDRNEIFERLKVVAIRIDPCFRERNTPSDCRRQIRMVWQPVLSSGQDTITADAAVHTFYDLEPDDWNQLLRKLRPLTSDDLNESLTVHPRIREQGLAGPHWSALKKILLNYAGQANLKRATAMSVNTLGSVWIFSGVDIENGTMKRITIPRAHHWAQGVVADISNLQELRFDIRPAPDAMPSWLNLVADSKGALGRIGEDGVREALRDSLRIENPKLEDTGSTDCVSCHIAHSVRLWGERQWPKWKWRAEDEAYKNNLFDLKNTSSGLGFVNRLRAFGYFVDEPSISQRLIHESAEVLESIRNSTQNDCADALTKETIE